MRARSIRVRPGAALRCALLAAAAWSALVTSSAAALRPSGDLVERFLGDPAANPSWHVSGAWEWRPQTTTLVSPGPGGGALLWRTATHFTGELAARVRLSPGADGSPGAARLLFAVDPAGGGSRWLEIRTGSPGRLLFGQTGAVRGSAAGVIQSWRAEVPAGRWLAVGLVISGDKEIAVTLDGASLFRAAAAPLAPGFVGFGSVAGAAEFDEFSFTADPDGEPCRECHAGAPGEPLAADVYAYWDGRWWDASRGGSPTVQQGGHGDPGGRPALGCTGAQGCHDLRLPEPGDHRNGVREGRGLRPVQPAARRTVNSYHLRPGFIVAEPREPRDAQVAFDAYCYTSCHAGAGVPYHSHELDSTRPPFPGVPGETEFGTHLTASDGESRPVFVDSDLTTRATTVGPDYAPCVACHDPHGTSAPGGTTNRMLRIDKNDPQFCGWCHL